MAKSAGNFQRVTELVDSGVDPLAFRYLALTAKYGRKLEYSDRSLRAAAARARVAAQPVARARRAADDGPWVAPAPLVAGAAGDRPEGDRRRAPPATAMATAYVPSQDRADEPTAPLSSTGRALHDRFVAAIDDDLDMPGAVALLREILRASIPAEERRWLVLDADLVLGLDLHAVWDVAAAGARDDADDVSNRRRRSLDARGARGGPGCRRLRARRRDPRRAGGPRLGGRRPAGRVDASGRGRIRERMSSGQPGRTSRSRREPKRSMIR